MILRWLQETYRCEVIAFNHSSSSRLLLRVAAAIRADPLRSSAAIQMEVSSASEPRNERYSPIYAFRGGLIFARYCGGSMIMPATMP